MEAAEQARGCCRAEAERRAFGQWSQARLQLGIQMKPSPQVHGGGGLPRREAPEPVQGTRAGGQMQAGRAQPGRWHWAQEDLPLPVSSLNGFLAWPGSFSVFPASRSVLFSESFSANGRVGGWTDGGTAVPHFFATFQHWGKNEGEEQGVCASKNSDI